MILPRLGSAGSVCVDVRRGALTWGRVLGIRRRNQKSHWAISLATYAVRDAGSGGRYAGRSSATLPLSVRIAYGHPVRSAITVAGIDGHAASSSLILGSNLSATDLSSAAHTSADYRWPAPPSPYSARSPSPARSARSASDPPVSADGSQPSPQRSAPASSLTRLEPGPRGSWSIFGCRAVARVQLPSTSHPSPQPLLAKGQQDRQVKPTAHPALARLMLRWNQAKTNPRQSVMTPDARPNRPGAGSDHCPRTHGGDHRDDRTVSKIICHRIVGLRPWDDAHHRRDRVGCKGRTMLNVVSAAAGGTNRAAKRSADAADAAIACPRCEPGLYDTQAPR